MTARDCRVCNGRGTEEQVEDFIATGIDFLAPAFGNVHGEYGKRGPVLEYDR